MIVTPPKQYKIYGILDSIYDVDDKLDLLEGNIKYFITEDLQLPEFCEIIDINDFGIISKKIKITKDNKIDYEWQDETTVLIKHNLNGIVDYVLRYKNLQRIITTDKVINENNLLIKIPEQITFNETDYLELIVYKISKDDIVENIFKYEEQNNSLEFPITLNSNQIEAIIRDINGNRVLFESEIVDNKIKFIIPDKEKYKNLISKIYIYTNIKSMTFNIQEEQSNVIWLKVTDNKTNIKYDAVRILHNLNTDTNIIIRDLNNNNNSLVKYSDYILDNGNSILIIFPNDGILKEERNLSVDIYPIFNNGDIDINVE